MGICACIRRCVVEYHTQQVHNHTIYQEDMFVPWGMPLVSDDSDDDILPP